MGFLRPLVAGLLFVSGCAAVDLTALGSPKFAADRQGNILVAGMARSCLLPVLQPAASICGLIWAAKLDPTGQTLLYATYVSPIANFSAIGTDAAGNLVLAGGTPGVWVTKLAADGSHIIYTTSLTHGFSDEADALAVDDQGAAYVLVSASQPAGRSSFVTKLSPDGQSQVYQVVLPWVSNPTNLQVDATGAAVLWYARQQQVWTISPDGSSLATTNPAAWSSSLYPNVFPRDSGGFTLIGGAPNPVIPTTPDAAQPYSGPSPYVRVQDGQAVSRPIAAHKINGFSFDPQNPARLYAATDGGLFVSGDNGCNWTLLRFGPTSAIVVDPFDSNRLYLGVPAPPLLYRSTDRGQTWQALNANLSTASNIQSIAADPNIPGLLYAAAGGLLRSADGGDTWTYRYIGPSYQDMSPSASISTSSQYVQADPIHPGWAYVLGRTGCIGFCPVTYPVLQTQDSGVTWNQLSAWKPGASGLYTLGFSSFALEPGTGDLFAVQSLFQTLDGSVVDVAELVAYRGGNFTNEVVFPQDSVTALAFDPNNPGTLYVADGATLLRSIDEGASFIPIVAFHSPPGQLAAGPGGVVHASQPANVEDAYTAVLNADGSLAYGSYFGDGSTHVNSVARGGGAVWIGGTNQAGGFVASFDDNGALLSSTHVDGAVTAVLPQPNQSAIAVVVNATGATFVQVHP